jgi:hypothetical protein
VWTDARTDRFATTVSETRLAAHRM